MGQIGFSSALSYRFTYSDIESAKEKAPYGVLFLLQDWFTGENLSLFSKADDGMPFLFIPSRLYVDVLSRGEGVFPKDMPLQSEHFHIV